MPLRAAITIHCFEQSVPVSMRLIKLCVDIWTLWSQEAPLSKDSGAKSSPLQEISPKNQRAPPRKLLSKDSSKKPRAPLSKVIYPKNQSNVLKPRTGPAS